MHKWLMAVMMLFSFPVLAGDPEDNKDVVENKGVPRMPGYYLNDGSANDFNEYLFPTGGEDENGERKGVTKEGRYWEFDYRLKEGARPVSFLEFTRNYENAFKKAGGQTMWTAKKDDSYTEAVYVQPLGKSERWVHMRWHSEGDGYEVHIIEVAGMQQKVEMSANEMAEGLKKNGFIALRGILFDTGKDTIKPESEALLAEIVSLLNADKALRLSVEGHTDNVGDKKANLALSKKRAESVRKHLVGKGIDAKRLKANGKGDTTPVADNRTEDGRAQNRRVELVKF